MRTDRNQTFDGRTGQLLEDVAVEVDDTAEVNAATIAELLAQAMDTLTATVTDMQTVSAGAPAVIADMDALLAAADPGSGTLTTAQLSGVVRQLAAATKTLARDLKTVTQGLRSAATDVESTARVLRRTLRKVRGDFTGTD